MDAIIGTILMILFDLLITLSFVFSLIYTGISWIIPTILFIVIAVAMYVPNKQVIGWWINKIKNGNN